MELRPGMRLRSAVCATEVVVVRAGGGEVDLRCGGHPMLRVPGDDPPAGLALVENGGTALGKRYADDDVPVELLCTKAGDGALSVAGRRIPAKASKPLPSSD